MELTYFGSNRWVSLLTWPRCRNNLAAPDKRNVERQRWLVMLRKIFSQLLAYIYEHPPIYVLANFCFTILWRMEMATTYNSCSGHKTSLHTV